MSASAHYADYASATGEIRYNMTNNYMFHYVLRESQAALKGLVASLLHIKTTAIHSITIENPFLIGDTFSAKDSILDLFVCFNDKTFVNLEMQIRNEDNWPERSLYYLCREYTTLRHGDDFHDARPVVHIGFLDFTLFDDHPEFYATYRMKNVKDGHLYSDKLTLSVVELNHIELATEEDKKYDVDKWARLFKARTWEELKMNGECNVFCVNF